MKRCLLFVLLLVSISVPLIAGNVMGSDLGFQSLGGTKYRIVLKVYRDCRGDSLRHSMDTVYLFVGNNGVLNFGNNLQSLSMNRVSITDITPRCSTSASPCNPANTNNTGEGFEEHVYTGDIDLSVYPFTISGLGTTYCELTVTYNHHGRNAAITTGAANEGFWTQSTINICNLNRCKKKENNSPKCQTAPVRFICCNQGFYLNMGVIDSADLDSVSYRLAAPLKWLGTPATFSSPFETRYPLTSYCLPTGITCTPNPKINPPRGFYFDTINGDMVFTPIKCDEVSITSVNILDYRKDTTGKYLLVGQARHEMQFIVKDNCGYNNAPTISGPTTNKVCEGDKICFSIYGNDAAFTPNQTIPDTVQMKWNGGIPGATFKIKNPKDREKEAEFCWQTKLGQASDVPYSFTVTATDDHCPKPLTAVKGFKVLVMSKAFDTRNYKCLNDSQLVISAAFPPNFNGTASVKWSFRDSNSNNEFFYSTQLKDTAKIKQFTRYVMVHTVNNSSNCPTIYRDTIQCKIFGVGVNPVVIKEVSIYPNPVHRGDYLTIPGDCSSIEIINLKGQAVQQAQAINGKCKLSAAVTPGMYLVKFCGKNMMQGKLQVID